MKYIYILGKVFKDYREEWIPGITMGQIYYTEWRLPTPYTVNKTMRE